MWFKKTNSVDSLLNYPFSRRSVEEKIEVKRLGRPTPHLIIIQKAKGRKTVYTIENFTRLCMRMVGYVDEK